MIELSPMIQPSPAHVTHERHDDTAADLSDGQLLRADTEECLGEEQTQPILGNLHVRTSNLPTSEEPDSHLTSELSPAWKAHHQDFYASKWFRCIQIFIIVSVISVAPTIYGCFAIGIDLLGPYMDIIKMPLFLFPIVVFFCIIIGGIFRSKVFR